MKKYKFLAMAIMLAGAVVTTSCGDDFLTNAPTEKQEAGRPATEGVILSNLTAAYQILLFDSYAANNYNSVLLMSDLRSDDLFKGGGSSGDQGQLYRLSQFTSTAAESLNGLWEIYFSGLARCNNVLIACENPVEVNETVLEQYKAEAHFLRAYYVHLLWKFFGNIPYFTEPLSPPYIAKQLKADEIYTIIMEDIDFACGKTTAGVDRLPLHYPADGDGKLSPNAGRVTKAAALMLKARVVMYQKDQSRYQEITNDMATIITSNQFELMKDFGAIWLDENEFCKESIFESNQLPEGKTWGTGWEGYGTNLPAFISANELNDPSGVFNGGWGFAPVRPAAYSMYDEGDTRRDGSILSWPKGTYKERFQDTGLFQRKYAARQGYNPPPGDRDLNYSNNIRLFRYAETLLNYAELVVMHGQPAAQGVNAQTCLDAIRERAFGAPNPIPATADNIKNERRLEFLGEGMRFWDLIRWGDATTVLTENLPEYNSTRTFEEWMKYIPIPQIDMERTKGTEFELVQNGQWK